MTQGKPKFIEIASQSFNVKPLGMTFETCWTISVRGKNLIAKLIGSRSNKLQSDFFVESREVNQQILDVSICLRNCDIQYQAGNFNRRLCCLDTFDTLQIDMEFFTFYDTMIISRLDSLKS